MPALRLMVSIQPETLRCSVTSAKKSEAFFWTLSEEVLLENQRVPTAASSAIDTIVSTSEKPLDLGLSKLTPHRF